MWRRLVRFILFLFINMVITLCFDFDWVIHWYREWWKDWTIYDEPVPWIKELINKLFDEWYIVVINSTRAWTPEWKKAIEDWLKKYDFPELQVYAEKPIAMMYVDDRGTRFMWNCDDLYAQIISFQWTWLERWFKARGMNIKWYRA